MMKKLFSTHTGRTMPGIRRMLFAASFFLLSAHLSIAQIVSWNPTGLTAAGPTVWTPTSVVPNITVTGLTKGSGIGGVATNNAWGGTNWAGAANQDGTFTIKANTGYQLSLTTLNLFYRRSGTGPASGFLQYAINGGPYTNIASLSFPSTSSSGAAHAPIDLSVVAALQNVPTTSTITIRLFPNTGASGGTWYVFGSGLSINGTVQPVPPACTAPTGLAATGVNASSANLNWGTVAGASGYQYVLDMNPADPAGAGTNIATTSYPASGLLPATTYYMHVRTDCGSGTYSSWVSTSFTTNPPCAVPTALTVNSSNSFSTDISWTSETGITGFEYVLDMNATDPAGAGTATTGNTFTDNTLTPSTTYYFHLRKNCGSGDFSNWINVSFTTNPPCADPTALTVNSFNSFSADLSWTSETGITGFEYVLDMNATDPAGAGIATTGNTFVDNTLTPSTTYYFHLRKNCGSGDFSNWINVSFTTNPPCADPTALTVNSFNASSTDIAWTSETGITGFEYVLDMNATDPAGAGTATTGNTFTDNTLTASTTYYFHLRKDCGSGDFSNWINVSFTTNPACADPTGLGLSSVHATSVDLTWDSETGITGFEYVLDMSAADPTGTGTTTTANVFSDNTLAPSTTYYFHLRKDCGSGDFSDWTSFSFTTNPPCNDPTSLTLNSFNASSVDLSWDSETGITGFEYVLDMSAADPTGAGTATTGNTFADNTLTPSTTYYFHLRKDCGSGDFSNWISVSFTTNAPCADPTGLSTAAVDHVSATLVWDNASGITGFEYVLDMSATDPAGAGTATTATSFNDNTLTPVTTYYFHLRKDCGSGDFSEWVTLSFTTLSIPTALDEIKNENVFTVYPNPTNGQLSFTTSTPGGTLSLTDLAGKTLLSRTVNTTSTQIDLGTFEPQVYFLVYQTTEGRQVSRIVKH